MWYLVDMGSVLTELLRTKYGAAAENASKQMVDLRKLQAWFPSLQIRSSQMLSLQIRREATELRLYRHADWPLGDFAINITLPAVSSGSSLSRGDVEICASVQPLCFGTWYLAPHAAYGEACSRNHANEVAVLNST